MESVTHSQVQEMVLRLPVTKLRAAHDLLVRLIGKENLQPVELDDFLQLPLEERRTIMARQASQLLEHYETGRREREEWQAGDFIHEH